MYIEDTNQFAGVVYGLHTGDYDYRYIGQTVRPIRIRFSEHKATANRGTHGPVNNWMRKHGTENIQVCVIATFDEDTIHLIDEVEIFHIAQARSYYGDNMNIANGGLSWGHGIPLEEQHRAKIAAALTGRAFSDDHRRNIAESWKTREPVSEATRAKMSASRQGEKNPSYGKPMAEATKAKVRLGRHNKNHPLSTWSVKHCEYCIEAGYLYTPTPVEAPL